MATIKNISESELTRCLEKALTKENLDSLSVEIVGDTEKGSGYTSDTIFVTVKGTDKNQQEKEYNFAVKCSKSSEALLAQSPTLLQACKNEAHMYNDVFPSFKKFQIDKGIEKPFESIPKCYGVFDSETKNVIALENLNKLHYHVWDQSKPLTRRHVDLIMGEYAKFHATSVAMQEQDSEKFQRLCDPLTDHLTKLFETSGFVDVFAQNMEEFCEFLKEDVGTDVLEKWSKFKDNVHSVFFDMVPNIDGLRVIVHGDCWNNNFMFKYEDQEKTKVSNVAILDWQASKLTSPILDLSYFLFSCLAKEDVEDMDVILKQYYDSFSLYLNRLGSKFVSKYPIDSFLNDWRKYGKYGVAMCITVIKVAFTDRKNIPDMGESADKGEDLSASFNFEISDETGYKNRMLPIVKYAAAGGLI